MPEPAEQPTISLIIPCLNEVRFIEGVVQNILAQDYPQAQLELCFVDGGSTDGTLAILEKYQQQYPNIRVLHNPARYVPQAMNQGIRASTGSIIIRLDAHAAYPSDYVSKLVRWLQHTGADNVGGVWETAPRNESLKARAIAQVLAHPLGVGNSLFRLGVDEPTEVDTVPFGCYPRSTFEKYGYYDERLQRNQDIELNKRIRQQGGRILLVPEVKCTYFARDTYRGLWRNNYQTGLWVILTAWYTRNLTALSLRHFVPMAFVGYVCLVLLGLLLSALGVLPSIWALVLMVPFCLYLLLLCSASSQLSWSSGKLAQFPYLFRAFLALHWGYGLGSWVGFGKVVFGRESFLPL